MQPVQPVPTATRAPAIAQLAWEGVLLLLCVGLVTAVLAKGGDAILNPWVPSSLATTGLQAVALAASLRTRTVNLAVAGVSACTGVLVIRFTVHMPFPAAIALALVLALVVGLLVGAAAAVTRVPAWAASLVLLGLTAWLTDVWGNQPLRLVDGHAPADPRTWLNVIAIATVLISLAGGVLWLNPRVRSVLAGQPWPDPAAPSVRTSLVGFGLSTVLAALAGVGTVVLTGSADTFGEVFPLVPFAIALLGGVSVFGGRGGIAGTALAALAMSLGTLLLLLLGAPPSVVNYLSAFLALIVGVGFSLVSRALSQRSTASGWPGADPAPSRPLWRATPPPGFGPPPALPVQAGAAGAAVGPQPAPPEHRSETTPPVA